MTTEHRFTCFKCGQDKTYVSDFSTGYGRDEHDNKICYECCALEDQRIMQETGKYHLYLDTKERKVTNWPGTLSYPVYGIKHSYHNFAGKNGRVDFWFNAFGYVWHGVLISPQWNQSAIVKRTKEQVRGALNNGQQ